ncbi:glycosyltransferase WbuB [Nonlabens tegetincola]|uniref:glycosyltransferase family 4 protein n=1 Tax=Nonlabens tegetincola TaxID=323273 RepID=UPI000A201CCA|nr:glycosyltransferase family 4 protein [Nonlabens tegetincola]ARN70869.1 glycosyltransferase WbuB [Nonlabens tegetincola]
MHILLIHQYFLEKNDGGGSRFNEMTKSWAAQGHQVTVLAGMVHYATGKKEERYKGKFVFKDENFYENVDVIRCHVSESYNSSFLGRLWAYFSFVFSSIYAGLFKVKAKHDVILVTSPPLFVGITAYVLSLLKRLPFVFEVRDLWPESAIDTGVLKNKLIIKFAYWFEDFIYKKAKLINVLTPAFRTKLIEKGVPSDKIIFIPNAADFSLAETVQADFDALAFKKGLGLEDKFVITYVGAHGVANHLIQLLDAAELLKDTKIVFQLIGSGMRKDQLIEEKNNRSLDNVIFREPVAKAEVFKYILSSDMGASVLKKVDTFKTIYSNKTFDYMSCKKPTLLAIDGVSRELIEEADCGIYVEPENASAIAQGIRQIMANEKRLLEMGINGYHHAKINFDRTVLATRYLEYIKTIMK